MKIHALYAHRLSSLGAQGSVAPQELLGFFFDQEEAKAAALTHYRKNMPADATLPWGAGKSHIRTGDLLWVEYTISEAKVHGVPPTRTFVDKTDYHGLPVADFKTIDETMEEARHFIHVQNRYNDIKQVTASAVCDYMLSQKGFRPRNA